MEIALIILKGMIFAAVAIPITIAVFLLTILVLGLIGYAIFWLILYLITR
jgi:hypothetical protein